MKFARGTPWNFIGVQAIVAIVLFAGCLKLTLPNAWAVAWLMPFVFAFGVAATVWVALLLFFFRDPERMVGPGVVSPCDGKVRSTSLTGPAAAISVFLRPTDVHVIRSPIAGKVTAIEHKSGGKRFAFSKDSHLNERLFMMIVGEGETVTLTLIAGAFADRVESYVKEGASLAKGERLGIIKFGSRVDLAYSSSSPLTLLVQRGGTVIAGETPILRAASEGGTP